MMRYVVLHHTEIEAPHYDLMYETSPESALRTWRLCGWPPRSGDAAEPIGDHRRVYLEFEGAVSGDRGRVTRVAAGCCDVQESADQVMIASTTDKWTLGLKRSAAGSWVVE